MPVKDMRAARNPYIQDLRGYAAMLVVVNHALPTMEHFRPLPKSIEDLAAGLGALGVHIFFVISGFIMTHISSESFGRPRASLSFLMARVQRVAPLYYCATFVAILHAMATSRSYKGSDIALSLLFLPSHAQHDLSGYLFPVLGVGWTLNYEMFFYLLFAIALSFKRSTGIALLTSALLFLIVIGSGLRWLSHPPVGASMAFDLPYYFTRDIMIYFVLGILMALLRRHRRFPSVAIPVPALLGCALGTSEVVVFTLLEPDQYPAWRIGVTILVAVAAVGLCIVAAPRKQSRVTGALGDASYSIYLFHDFFLSIITSLWLGWFGKSFVAGEILSCVVLGAGGGYLVYLWVERPLSAITRQKAVRRVTTMNQSLLSIEQG